jgi:hypothetical protein
MSWTVLSKREFRRLGKHEIAYVRYMTREQYTRAFRSSQWPDEAGAAAYALCDGSGKIITLAEDEGLILAVAADMEVTAHRLS